MRSKRQHRTESLFLYSKGWFTATITPLGEIKVRLLANFTTIKEINNDGITRGRKTLWEAQIFY